MSSVVVCPLKRKHQTLGDGRQLKRDPLDEMESAESALQQKA